MLESSYFWGVIFLGIAMIVAALGIFVLAYQDKASSSALVAICSIAVGALAALLSRNKRNQE